MGTNTHLLAFDGSGPYEYSELKSSEITILFNPVSGNYLFFLTSEEYGPVISNSNFEEGKKHFIEAFGVMLTVTSVMSMDEAKEKFLECHKGESRIRIKRKFSPDMNAMANKGRGKIVEIEKELDFQPA